MAHRVGMTREVIEILDDDFQEPGINADPASSHKSFAYIEISDDEDEDPRSTSAEFFNARTCRNGPVSAPWVISKTYPFEPGLKIVPGTTWELKEPYWKSARYFYVCQIIRNLTTNEVKIRGLAMFPNENLEGMLDHGAYADGSTYLSIEVDRNDPRPCHVQGMVEFPPSSFDLYVPCKFSSRPYNRSLTRNVLPHLICRRFYLQTFSNAAVRMSKSFKLLDTEYTLQLLSDSCIAALLAKAGIAPDLQRTPAILRRLSDQLSCTSQEHDNLYTYTSYFSGFGGDTRGARDAGAVVKRGIDFHEPANVVNRMNHPTMEVIHDSMCNIANHGSSKADISHASCSCKVHSSAHTRPGKNDDANNMTSLLFKHIIEIEKDARIFTAENVKGLMVKEDSKPYFAAVINQMAETGEGLNVRWKLFDFREYGLASRRTRFVAFASRRGVPLPPFPLPTHGPRGSRRFTTTRDILNEISDSQWVTHNEVGIHSNVFKDPREPYDASTKVKGCITTNGGRDDVHPSGKGSFTLRQLGCLNGIPKDFIFPDLNRTGNEDSVCKSGIKAQIGNCIPPLVWKQFVKSIIDHLKAFDNGEIDADGASIRATRPRIDLAAPNVTDLDGDHAGRVVISLDDDDEVENATPKIEREMRLSLKRISISASRESSRTLSPEVHAEPERPWKRSRVCTWAPTRPIIDLTGEH